jgi:phosphoenolpyruvate synthase/pyruvate phosphate dikinase
MMCEVPSNAILAERFLEFFDGFSIGSNDLTQLTLGLDRDSGMELLAKDFDERDPAVKAMLTLAIKACLRAGQVHRHLRPGAVGQSGLRAVAGGAGHRVDVAEPGLGDRYLAEAGGDVTYLLRTPGARVINACLRLGRVRAPA